MWKPSDFAFDAISIEDSVVMASLATPAGAVEMMAEVEIKDRAIRLQRLHMQGPGANAIGAPNLRALADFVLERMDLDEIIVEGAVRTTGARPGHTPHALRFARRSGAASGR